MTAYFMNRQADNYRLCSSRLLQEPADDTYEIIRIPWKAYVHGVDLLLVTAYGDAGATITVGFEGNKDTADVDYFLTSANIDPDGTAGHNVSTIPKHFADAGGAITVTCDDNGGTIGTFQVFCQFSIIH